VCSTVDDVGGGLKYEVSVLYLRRREGGCQQFGFETMFEAQVEPVKCISLGVTTNRAESRGPCHVVAQETRDLRNRGVEDEAHGPPCAFIRASGSQGWPLFASRRLPSRRAGGRHSTRGMIQSNATQSEMICHNLANIPYLYDGG
jgi:hypothetical protein